MIKHRFFVIACLILLIIIVSLFYLITSRNAIPQPVLDRFNSVVSPVEDSNGMANTVTLNYCHKNEDRIYYITLSHGFGSYTSYVNPDGETFFRSETTDAPIGPDIKSDDEKIFYNKLKTYECKQLKKEKTSNIVI